MSKQITLAGLAAIALLVAVGCSQDRAPATAGNADPAAPASGTPCPEPAYTAMPDGVALGQAFHVRSDRVYATKAGGERRRTWLEVMQGDPVQLVEQVVAELEADGYEQVEARERDDGITRLAVQKRGAGRINISASRDLGARPSHPRAVGMVGFDWPVAGGDEGTGEGDEVLDGEADAAADPAPNGM